MGDLLENILNVELSGSELMDLAGWPPALAEDYLSKGDSLKLIAEAVLEVATQTDVPATATSTGTAGNIAMDSSYFYVCIAADTWRRVSILAW